MHTSRFLLVGGLMDHRENGMESTGEAAGASVELQGP